ncbi:MAG TPA: hypothetical protein DIT04_11835 [Dysgonomonas sp.]|nr:hypothetical protein [Dysgonomonas sp.]
MVRYAFISLCLLCTTLQAQNIQKENTHPKESWYIGLQGGVPFGINTFNSFGSDKIRLGYSGGLFCGYHLNPILSLEAQAAWGSFGMSARDCCTAYWLGADENRYLVPVLGEDGWSYADLYSEVSLQRYGLQLNVDVLQLFSRNSERRLTLEVSPLLAVTGTKARIKTRDGDKQVMKGDNNWHLGAGGNLSMNYRINQNLSLGIYSGIIWLTGSQIDGMPQHIHQKNYIWESGMRLGWTFGKKPKPRQLHTPATPVEVETAPLVEQPTIIIEVAQPIEEKQTVTQVTQVEQLTVTFPTIFFAFNSIRPAPGQRENLQEILAILLEEPEMKITLTGWCDNRGSVAINNRISHQRAEAVKKWLVSNGIPAGRIHATGKGIDNHATDDAKARRVETKTEEK